MGECGECGRPLFKSGILRPGEMRGESVELEKASGDPPVIITEAGSPVGCPQQSLHCTGQVHKHVAHQEKPKTEKGPETGSEGRQKEIQKESGEERE